VRAGGITARLREAVGLFSFGEFLRGDVEGAE